MKWGSSSRAPRCLFRAACRAPSRWYAPAAARWHAASARRSAASTVHIQHRFHANRAYNKHACGRKRVQKTRRAASLDYTVELRGLTTERNRLQIDYRPVAGSTTELMSTRSPNSDAAASSQRPGKVKDCGADAREFDRATKNGAAGAYLFFGEEEASPASMQTGCAIQFWATATSSWTASCLTTRPIPHRRWPTR